jgi:acetolactate decarboxylase
MEPRATDVIDERLIRGLHVEAVRRAGVHDEHKAHLLFQTSTLDALLEGDFDGDLTFAELARHGDLGLGTLNGLDGEMIALDGRFLRADVDGDVTEIPPSRRTPFAVVIFFEPTVTFTLEGPIEPEALFAELDRRAPPGARSCAVRIDGRFEHVHARSVPRQSPPYGSLAEVARQQHEFQFDDVEGTIVGFGFPQDAQGLELAGYHLHFVDAARRRGGHVLGCRPARVEVQIDFASEMHLELPPGVELGTPGADADKRKQISEIEGEG